MSESANMGELERELTAERKKVAAVRSLGRVFGATLDLERLLPLLLEQVTEILDAERATIFLVDGGEMVSTLVQGGVIDPIRLRVGEGIAGWVAQSGATVNIPDAYADPRFLSDSDQRSGFRTRSILCMPMPDHLGQVIGVIQALNKRARPFDIDDEALLGTICAHAGISIENSKLYQAVVDKNRALLIAQGQLEQRIEELDLLVEIEEEASLALALDEFLDRLLGRATQLLDAEAGSVLLREESSGQLFFRSAVGTGSETLRRLQIPSGMGVVGWVALHRQPLLVNEPTKDVRHDASIAERIGVPARHILAVPLIDASEGEQRPLGAIEVLNRRKSAGFDAADLKLLTLLAGQAARAIVLSRSREERVQSDRLASIGQMISGMLHDLKTPMTIASGYTQLMALSDSSETRAEQAELVLKQFDLMASMTRDVLSFARGESSLLIRKVFLSSFIETIRKQLERELAGLEVELSVRASYTGVAHFDEHKIFRVIHNLARNAAQAMNGKGTLILTIDAEGSNLVMSVSDTGPGLPAELEGRLFTAFASVGKKDGTGLGLAIVKKIVDDHGGSVSAMSSGEGTTFTVRLPRERALSESE